MNLGDYINSHFLMSGHRITTNDESIYKSITENLQFIKELLNLTRSENELKIVIDNYLKSTQKSQPNLIFVNHSGVICCAKHIAEFLSPGTVCVIEDPKVKDTVKAIYGAKEDTSTPEQDFLVSSAQLLFSPSYANLNPYMLNASTHSEKTHIIQQVSLTIPPNFSYTEEYSREYLSQLHKEFTSKINNAQPCAPKKDYLQSMPEKLNAYQYVDYLSEYFSGKNETAEWEIDRIEELLWKPVTAVYLYLLNKLSLEKYMPYLQARKFEKVIVTFASEVEECDVCPQKNILKCAIQDPCPSIELRRKAFSISDVGKLRTNPIAFYLESILEVKQLNFSQNHTMGMMIHHALEQCVKTEIKSEEQLKESVQTCIEKYNLSKLNKSILLRKVNQMIGHLWPLIENADALYSEVEGVQNIIKSGENYKLHGRVDLIYKTKTGEYGVIDFKSGTVPSWIKIESGCAPQGPLEVLLLASGAFIAEKNIKLAPCGLLSPKGFFKIESNIPLSAQQISSLLDVYWIEGKSYKEYVINKYPVYSRIWEPCD